MDKMNILFAEPEAQVLDNNLQELSSQIESLQIENNKLAVKQIKTEDSLPQLPNYDTKLFASVDDVCALLKKYKVLDSSDGLVDARYFLKIFGLKGQGQVKETLGRGRGKVLYLRPQVVEAINKVLEIKK